MYNIYRITNRTAKTRGVINTFVPSEKRARKYYITAQSEKEALDFAVKTELFGSVKRSELDCDLYRANVQPLRFSDKAEPKAKVTAKKEEAVA